MKHAISIRFGAAAVSATLCISASSPATAHHSFAMYDVGTTHILTGVVTRLDPNPNHLQLFVAPLDEPRDRVIRDADGEPVVWAVETDGAAGAAREGITVNAFPPGTIVSVGVHPLRNGFPGGARGESGLFKCPAETPPEPGQHCDSVSGATAHGDGALPEPTEPLPGTDVGEQSETPAAKGDQQRRYYFAEADEEMPYRLYVPDRYDPSTPMPLVVALHGHGGDQNTFFNAVDNLPELCEQYGFIFVAPMGFAADGWYGAPLSIPGDAPRSSGASAPPPVRTPEEEARYRALSETDVINVIDIVREEYAIDPGRIYLMGHSMGGFGTWWLGQKYADLWAAIAPMSGALPDVDYQLPKLEQVAVHVSIGGAEYADWIESSKQQVEMMREMGMATGYFEPPGANHGSMVAPTVPRVLEFFSRHERSAARIE